MRFARCVRVKKQKIYNYKMLWNEVDMDLIQIDEDTGSITYDNGPFRFQIPVGFSEFGIDEWSRVRIQLRKSEVEFENWYRILEDSIGKIEPEMFDSILNDTFVNVKFVDGFTQVFNIKKELQTENVNISSSTVYTIIELSKRYGPFKERYGFTTKAYQIVFDPICYF